MAKHRYTKIYGLSETSLRCGLCHGYRLIEQACKVRHSGHVSTSSVAVFACHSTLYEVCKWLQAGLKGHS